MKKTLLTIFIVLVTLSSGFASVTITGNAGVANAVLTYYDGTFKTVTADGTGLYSISITSTTWTGSVTPSLGGYWFSPICNSYYDASGSIPNANFTASNTGVFTITGSVKLSGGTAIPNAIISYTNGTITAQTLSDGAGNYIVSVGSGWSGSVGASLPGYTFTPNAGYKYTAIAQNYTFQDFVGATTTYAAISSISGGTNNGSTFSFKIYSRSVGTSGITLSTSSYYLFYNTAVLGTAVSATLGANFTSPSYAIAASIVSGEIAVTLTYNGSTSRLLATTDPGDEIGTVSINILDATKTSGISWDIINSGSSDVNIAHAIADSYTGIENDLLPVELSTFITSVNDRNVQINWETKTEKNSDRFLVQRRLVDGNVNSWVEIGSVKAAVLSNSPKQYSLVDQNLNPGRYNYRLKMVDNDGTFDYSKVLEAAVATPKLFDLGQNYPNPFNPTTKISYNLPFDSHVTLEVFNIAGERISQLVNENKPAGFYSADFGSSLIKRNISSGVYFYKLTAVDNSTGKNFSSIKKMMLLK